MYGLRSSVRSMHNLPQTIASARSHVSFLHDASLTHKRNCVFFSSLKNDIENFFLTGHFFP